MLDDDYPGIPPAGHSEFGFRLIFPSMKRIQDLGAFIDSSTMSSVDVSNELFKARLRLVILNRTFVRLTPSFIHTDLYRYIISSHREYYAQV